VPFDVGAWPGITLQQVEQDAALQTRVDRKYVVTQTELVAVLDAVGVALQVLEIAGERIFAYHSTYFDTPELASYRAAATGRRQRFKVRTRAYSSTNTTWLEVKLRDRHGQTSKQRVEHNRKLELDASAASFLEGFDQIRPHVARLQPSITTTYERATLLCASSNGPHTDGCQQRVTIDVDIVCRRPDGTPLATLGEHLIVETKSDGARPGAFDKAMWRIGARPLPISKYAVGIACARSDLTANRWRRVLRRYVQPTTNRLTDPQESLR
jgi:VTC domain